MFACNHYDHLDPCERLQQTQQSHWDKNLLHPSDPGYRVVTVTRRESGLLQRTHLYDRIFKNSEPLCMNLDSFYISKNDPIHFCHRSKFVGLQVQYKQGFKLSTRFTSKRIYIQAHYVRISIISLQIDVAAFPTSILFNFEERRYGICY